MIFQGASDARDAQGNWNPSPTDVRATLQAKIDAAAGDELVIPPGDYYLRAKGGGAAVAVTKPTAIRCMPGAVFYLDGDAQTDGFLFEYTPDVHAWSNLRPSPSCINLRGWHFAPGSFRHGIVLHHVRADIYGSQVCEAGGWGYLAESGTAGVNLEGATLLPAGTLINCNWGSASGCTAQDCGDQSYPGTQAGGGGFRVHGSDVNGWTLSHCVGTAVNVGFCDGSLEGVKHDRCYVEVGGPTTAVGYQDYSASGALYIRCREEIAIPSVPGPRSRSIGGGLFTGTPAASCDADLTSVVTPLRNTVDRWSWRQRGVAVQPGSQVIKTAPNWSASWSLPRADHRTTPLCLNLSAVVQMATTEDWSKRLSANDANAQVAARAQALAALDVRVDAVSVGYLDDAGSLFLARVTNGTGQTQTVDIVWSGEFYLPSTPNTSGP